MCYWKMQCGLDVQARQSPSKGKGPRYPSYEFKWLQMQKKHDQLSSSGRTSRGRNASWDSWHNRNITICWQLATDLNMTVCEVSELLFNLTFQNYGKILNPKGAGWNICRVPLCVANVGHCYLDIFDLEGNLRDPTDPKSLYKLLRFLHSVVQSDPNSDFLKREYVESLAAPLSTSFRYNSKLKHLVDSSSTDYELEVTETPVDTNNLLVNKRGRKLEVYQQKRNSDEIILFDEWGRRFGYGSKHLNTLRKHVLINLIKKAQKGDPERFLKSLSMAMMPVKKKKNIATLKTISNFYTEVTDEELSNANDFGNIVEFNINYLPGDRRASFTKSIVSLSSLRRNKKNSFSI